MGKPVHYYVWRAVQHARTQHSTNLSFEHLFVSALRLYVDGLRGHLRATRGTEVPNADLESDGDIQFPSLAARRAFLFNHFVLSLLVRSDEGVMGAVHDALAKATGTSYYDIMMSFITHYVVPKSTAPVQFKFLTRPFRTKLFFHIDDTTPVASNDDEKWTVVGRHRGASTSSKLLEHSVVFPNLAAWAGWIAATSSATLGGPGAATPVFPPDALNDPVHMSSR